jgi:2-keto-4-pentenoate hydratase/2-oxohepta-3-ene-1,7-dioic acid hydratase in catechol pathway
MRLARLEFEGRTGVAAVADGEAVLLQDADPRAPADMLTLLAAGEEGRRLALTALERGPRRPLSEARVLAPVPRPPKFLGVGLNYADHIAETGRPRPEFPLIFNKQSTCVSGPYDPIQLPRVSEQLDYEGELGFVIGCRCRHVGYDDAAGVIAGYLVVNDVSVRDWQRRAATMTLGKSFDTHGPLGPWIVTGDELGDPHQLELRTWVNGELRQQSNTSQLVFDCYYLVEVLSTVCTLEPGDVITTGTPAGVAGAMSPPRWLRPGDRVRIEIEGIGQLENEVVPEP